MKQKGFGNETEFIMGCAHVLVCERGCEYRRLERGWGLGGLYVQAPATGWSGIQGQLLGRPSVWAHLPEGSVFMHWIYVYILSTNKLVLSREGSRIRPSVLSVSMWVLSGFGLCWSVRLAVHVCAHAVCGDLPACWLYTSSLSAGCTWGQGTVPVSPLPDNRIWQLLTEMRLKG